MNPGRSVLHEVISDPLIRTHESAGKHVAPDSVWDLLFMPVYEAVMTVRDVVDFHVDAQLGLTLIGLDRGVIVREIR